ncbi:MAG TPA: transglycosylase SLT domain-containing protein [Thermodesulfobacteriota bacterium]
MSSTIRSGAAAGLVLGACLALPAALPSARAADIYRCIDADGVVHFSNAPTKDCFVRIIVVRPERSAPQPPPSATQAGVAKYEPLIAEAAARHKVEPALIKAVIRAESNFDPRAISRKGAQGLMQLMPETASLYGLSDPFEPRANIEAGVRHLKRLLEKYDGDLRLALAAYNAGEQAVERYGRRIPPFPETQGYVRTVLRHHEAYGGAVRTASK